MSWEAWGDPPDPEPTNECPICHGEGWIFHHDSNGDVEEICDYCDGEGEIVDEYEPFEDDVI